MRIFDRYVAVTLGVHFLYSLSALLAIFTVVNFMQEMGRVGSGDYGFSQALWFIFLTLPNEAYKLVPAAALLGSTMGFGSLAAGHELVALNAAGVSPARLSVSALQAGALLMVGATLLGELVAAPLVGRAQGERSSALSGGMAFGTASGLWARDGSSFIYARSLTPDGTLAGLYVFDIDAERRLTRFIRAERATYADGEWVLENVVDSRFSGDSATTRREPSGVWRSLLKPRQLSFLSVPADDLSLTDLRRSIRSLNERSESSERERLAFWRRLSWPLVAVVMVYVALPFVLRGPQRTTAGKRIAVGALAGVGFQMFNATFGSFALAYGVDPRLCALLPTVLALGVGLWAMRFVR